MQDPCMGRGTCVCGSCQCQSGYYGKYCQKSTSMTTCEKLEPCVKLKTFKPEGEDADESESILELNKLILLPFA